MPYLVKIGPIKENETGVGSRGYHLYLRGRSLVSEWGPIEVVRGVPKRFIWSYGPQSKVHHYGSAKSAREAFNETLLRKEAKGYSRLPVGVKISTSPERRNR